jgi:hypothetical protein
MALSAAIKDAAIGRTSIIPANLYGASGPCISLFATFCPFSDVGGFLVGCKISFEYADTVTQHEQKWPMFTHYPAEQPELIACSDRPVFASNSGAPYTERKGRPARQDAISHETLQNLWHLTVQQAADKLGVSLTTLKSACRRLGIARWPRNAGRTPPTAPPADSAFAGPARPVPVSLAYTRRLLRKYATAEARSARRAAMTVGAGDPSEASCSPPSCSHASSCIAESAEWECGAEGYGSSWDPGSPASTAPSDPAWELALEAAAPLSAEAWAAAAATECEDALIL